MELRSRGPASLVVTIDTEADSMWDRPATYAFSNTRGLERLQGFLESHGAVPTYLVTYEVASDPESAAVLSRFAREGRAEIGAHLHPWSNPPFERVCDDEDRHHPFPHDYGIETFERKMRELSGVLRERLGVEPRSYRAGRWGFIAEHGTVLQRLGYVVDTSVTPGVSWEQMSGRPGGRGGPSYIAAPRAPYLMSPSNATKEAEGGLLEVPVTIEWDRDLSPLWERRVDRWVRFRPLMRALRRARLLRAIWLRPYPRFGERDLLALCDRLLERGRPVWNVMFHSSEATAGTSPYSRDDAALEAWYGKLGAILRKARESGVRPSTLTAFAGSWSGQRRG